MSQIRATEPDPTLIDCVQAATLAPSVHNSQPWRFRAGHDRIDVLTDADRRLLTIDPSGREAMISVGAAILNLRVAILNSGRTPMTTLLPDPSDQHLAATVVVGPAHRPDGTVRALSSAISQRRTNRRPFRDIEVRNEVLDQLVVAARVEGGHLAVADDTGRRSILALVRTANEWQTADAAYTEELRQWTGPAADRGDGIPVRSFGPVDDLDVLPLRDFGHGRPQTPRRLARFEATPTIAVLYSATDTAADWLRTGQALERVLLTATVRGVATTPITAPTELPGLRELLTDGDDIRCAQVIIRLGYGDPCPPTPRRPLREVLTVLSPAS
jgi:nitroreductase